MDIRISYNHLLEPLYKRLFAANPKNAGIEFPPTRELLRRTEECKAAWASYEDQIVRGMREVLGLEFRQAEIDAHVAYARQSLSNPMIIGLDGCAPDRFIDVLTHELLHRLLTDNTRKIDVRKIWSEMFPDLELLARNHMLVHAAHQHIYLMVLNDPARLERDIFLSGRFPAYKQSWEIVKRRGHEDIIAEFRARYTPC